MTKVWLCAVLILGSALGAAAQTGAPVVGQQAGVYLNTVSVTWDGVPADEFHNNEASMLGGFTLFAALTPGGSPVARAPLPWPPPDPENPTLDCTSCVPSFSFPNVPDGTYYLAVVKGIVQSAIVPAPNWSPVTINYASCGSVPGAPTNLRRSTGGQANLVVLFWDLAPGCAPQSLQLEAGSSPGASDKGVFQVQVQSGWGGVAPPATYYVRVRARNHLGVSAPSNEIQVVVDPPQCSGPSAPLNLTASVVNQQVTLTWNPPVDSGTRPVSFYYVSAGSSPGGNNLAFVRVTTTSLVASTVPSGTYHVRVQAGNTCSNAGGVPSNDVMVVVP